MSVERLTVKHSGIKELKGFVNVSCDEICKNHICEKCPVQKAIDKLAEYENLEEQVLLIRLPCKVGDTLYEASRQWKTVITRTVAAIVICNNNIWIRNGCGDTFEYGAEVFLTREEAEAALAEMEK